MRIAELDEMKYRRLLWDHQPITDFWRVGRGYARKLAEHGMFTLGDVVRCSTGNDGNYYNEDLLYQLFGVNAELLIDHAWGWEPTTIELIRQYKPETNSLCPSLTKPGKRNLTIVPGIIRRPAAFLTFVIFHIFHNDIP